MKSLLLLGRTACVAALTISDPSDVIPPSAWAADNAIVPNYNGPRVTAQSSPNVAAYTYNSTTNVDHETLSTNANDTSVILVNGGTLNASYINVVKSGYSSNQIPASFYGLNAAIKVANGSKASLNHINVTVHNGAANIYSYGPDTVIRAHNAWLYSSGPVSHGLHAAGNGTIVGTGVKHFSGGIRSSSFTGDAPASTINVYNSVAHTQGIGSATYYALGTIYAENVISLAEKAPVILADGAQDVTLMNCDGIAGLLGGAVFFNSGGRPSTANLRLIDSRITVTGSTVPGLWFGNAAVNVAIQSSQINTGSGVLVVANTSGITQDFEHYTENSALPPADVRVEVSESALVGNLIAYNGSSVSWSLTKHSTWVGAAFSGYGAASFNVALDNTSTWTLTRNSTVQHLVSEDMSLSNIRSNGHTLRYNASAPANRWLGGKVVNLFGGGAAAPLVM